MTDQPQTVDGDQTVDGQEARPASRRRLLVVGLAVLLVAAVVAAVLTFRALSAEPAEAVPATVPVPVTVAHVPDRVAIGVVVTLGDGEGSEWNQAAQGAVVAQRRLALGGTRVQLVTQNDSGTTDGARAAVEELVRQHVAGIVVASSGAHVAAAAAAAADAGIPVVMPYAGAVDDAWSTAPSSQSVASAMQRALGGAASPLLVDLGGGAPAGLRVAHVLPAGDTDMTSLATTVAARTGAVPTSTPDGDTNTGGDAPAADSDAVVVSGSAARQGAFVAALQATDVTVPVVLTPDATSPAFGSALTAAGGSVSGDFRTAGVATDDATALDAGAAGRAMSAFLGAVRVVAKDQDARNLTGDQPFSAVAAAADARSHDAVIALVHAVGAARSTDPEAVTDALATTSLDVDDGLAGPALDFTDPQALGTGATVLASSAQALGLRPETTSAPALVWFEDTTGR
ncbi:ABC transporter substrate-binding protein [Curtobacterium sp. 9128]|uniref:ABC transporter substrate-binding protein n=1 Tax=Curtobacterium sp. 9128 TaxID=1793722 RepID=UPI0011A3033B|nr:ABC transporter substrate-binding protein [Curtobacterium sp. 9128]